MTSLRVKILTLLLAGKGRTYSSMQDFGDHYSDAYGSNAGNSSQARTIIGQLISEDALDEIYTGNLKTRTFKVRDADLLSDMVLADMVSSTTSQQGIVLVTSLLIADMILIPLYLLFPNPYFGFSALVLGCIMVGSGITLFLFMFEGVELGLLQKLKMFLRLSKRAMHRHKNNKKDEKEVMAERG